MVLSRNIYGVIGTLVDVVGISFFLVFGPAIIVYGPDWWARALGAMLLAIGLVWMWVIKWMYEKSSAKQMGKGIIGYLFDFNREEG